jgi:CheY-like chemotaxis protein
MLSALVIEDNHEVADSLCQMLKIIGIPAKAALTPRLAIVSLQENIPDLIFLDIHLPGLNGFDIMAYLRREPRYTKTPVLIVTSDDQPDTYRRARENGASAVLIKPITVEAIQKALKSMNISLTET